MKNWEIPKKMKTPWTREKLLMTKKKIYVPMTLLETTMLSKLIDKKVMISIYKSKNNKMGDCFNFVAMISLDKDNSAPSMNIKLSCLSICPLQAKPGKPGSLQVQE